MDAKRKSDAALEGLIAYYREWRTRNETILKYRQSSEKSAASEMQNIKSAADRTRAELESLKRRAADLSGLGADAGRSATLRDLIESVEANLRNWEDILLESKAESPGRQKAIAGAETLVKSISESILLTQDQRKLYAERYSARLDGFKLYCRNK
jgi:hypothetical protein